MGSVAHALIAAAEKAANIARACRREPPLLELLVQRKGTADSNPRFLNDFKTLADVLIQETVRHDLAAKFPDLIDQIHGEESNKFSNTLGETITVEVQETEAATSELLCKVLNGDRNAADLLAAEVHKDIEVDDINSQISGYLDLNIPVKNLSIWIDPIDSTAEYISGDSNPVSVGSISLSGLQCVTVLIGAFDRQTGEPVIGVLNQPFYDGSKGRCLWGINYMGKKIFFNPMKDSPEKPDDKSTSTICISSSESSTLKDLLSSAGYNLIESAGAGYKLLMVILGYADAYILSKPTTFKWDTCGPHAILNSLGGGILDYTKALSDSSENENCDVIYQPVDKDKNETSSISEWCNHGGIIAYKNCEIVSKILDILIQ